MNVYLDNQSTTPCDRRVLEKMLPFFSDKFGNPHSDHLFGYQAADAVSEARQHIAKLINAKEKEIIFTSGATESNNLAIKGVAEFYKNKNHIITTQIEHKCVLASCKRLEKKGFNVTYLPVDHYGRINLQQLEENIRPETLLISVIFANNEVGTIQPIKEIGEICKKHSVIFHTDAAQAVGKVKIDVEEMNIDLLSLSSHKIYGPKGIGALYRRTTGKRVNLSPIIDGGGQESGIRSGTLATPLCIGFGEACRIANNEMDIYIPKILELQKSLQEMLFNGLDNIFLNGDKDNRIPGNLNISFQGVESEALIFGLKTIAVSSGSACSSGTLEPSYVLVALNIPENLINSSIRIGIGKQNTYQEIEYCANQIIKTIKKLRKISAIEH